MTNIIEENNQIQTNTEKFIGRVASKLIAKGYTVRVLNDIKDEPRYLRFTAISDIGKSSSYVIDRTVIEEENDDWHYYARECVLRLLELIENG